ncbi:MAG TPA: hypothetical protein VJL88_13365 [Nitrospira sp.]|nr:hypothetical protein [Nitrospira sp.]
MNTLLQPLTNRQPAAFHHLYRSGLPSTPTLHPNTCLIARIGWCHRQAVNALTSAEADGWWAEKQGLIDALLHRDDTDTYKGRPGLRARYAMGLEDGGSLIRTAKVKPSCHHRYQVL